MIVNVRRVRERLVQVQSKNAAWRKGSPTPKLCPAIDLIRPRRTRHENNNGGRGGINHARADILTHSHDEHSMAPIPTQPFLSVEFAQEKKEKMRIGMKTMHDIDASSSTSPEAMMVAI